MLFECIDPFIWIWYVAERFCMRYLINWSRWVLSNEFFPGNWRRCTGVGVFCRKSLGNVDRRDLFSLMNFVHLKISLGRFLPLSPKFQFGYSIPAPLAAMVICRRCRCRYCWITVFQWNLWAYPIASWVNYNHHTSKLLLGCGGRCKRNLCVSHIVVCVLCAIILPISVCVQVVYRIYTDTTRSTVFRIDRKW